MKNAIITILGKGNRYSISRKTDEELNAELNRRIKKGSYGKVGEYSVDIFEDFTQEDHESKSLMESEIKKEAKKYYGTDNNTTVNAFYRSWSLKSTYPEYYTNDGLIAFKEIAGFTKNQALNTPEKIKAFHTALLMDLIKLDKFRDTKIKEHLDRKKNR